MMARMLLEVIENGTTTEPLGKLFLQIQQAIGLMDS
jgi:hypothetical protein